jgi:hypothetical protein
VSHPGYPVISTCSLMAQMIFYSLMAQMIF